MTVYRVQHSFPSWCGVPSHNQECYYVAKSIAAALKEAQDTYPNAAVLSIVSLGKLENPAQ